MNSRILLASLLVFGSVSGISADEPLRPPLRHEVDSPSKKYIATVDPKSGVVVRATGSSQTLWKSSKIWSRSAFLADDGEHFVTEYDGLNLIPTDYKTNLVLITFWQRNEKLREVTVGELFPDTNVLRRTVSHYDWGGIQGITNTTLTVVRCDGRHFRFDITTGKVTK